MPEESAESAPRNLSQVITEIEGLSKTIVDNLHSWSRPDWSTVFDQLDEQASSYVDQVIGTSVKASADTQPTEPSTLIDIIKSRRERLALSSSTTEQIVGISKQILAFGAAGLALSLGFGEKFHTFTTNFQKLIALTGIFYIELVLVSLITLIWYLLQAHFRYPFLYLKKIGNSWPYFYYGSIDRKVSRFPLQTAKTRVADGARYAEDFLRFSEVCLKETPRERLRAELQQYFLLISYQGYVQQFALRLSNLFFYGFAGSVVSTLLLSAWSFTR
jgi:hypothetical protein